jgi:L-2-hydroxyglutarate oxidase LhgO
MAIETDFIIAGSGIVGVSIAISLAKIDPGLRILVAEKESLPGIHASGRNSGVLHAGFYYTPDSLKAQFCREGNIELRNVIAKHNLPIREIGKVVVAKDDSDFEYLERLQQRGVDNDVKLYTYPRKRLEEFEPLAITHKGFLWSPTTAVSDPKLVISALKKDAEALGVKFRFGASVTFQDGQIYLNGEVVKYQHFINSAGSSSDRIAKEFGFANEYTMIPFMGLYKESSSKYLALRTLVYPTPHRINPFLGVHLTLTVQGKVKIGPTAIPLLGREQYNLFTTPSLADLKDSLIGVSALVKGDAHSLSKILLSELPNLLMKNQLNAAALLVPDVRNVSKWKKKSPGIRSQLVNIQNGKLEQDFKIEGDTRSTHVLNVVSPGWTSAIPFGAHIAKIAYAGSKN